MSQDGDNIPPPPPPPAPASAPLECRVFVKNLPRGTSESDVKDFFSKCGEVVRADIRSTDRGVHAFVDFAEKDGATEAVKLTGQEMNGNVLTVEPKNPPSERKCFSCGKEGHAAARCPNGRGGKTCFRCGKVGHISRDCSSQGKRDRSPPRRYDDSRDRRRDDSRDRRRRDDSRDRRRDDSRDRRRDDSRERRRDDSRDRRR